MSYEHEAVAPAREKPSDVLLDGPFVQLDEPTPSSREAVVVVTKKMKGAEQRLVNAFIFRLLQYGVDFHDLAELLKIRAGDNVGAVAYFMRKILENNAISKQKEKKHVSK